MCGSYPLPCCDFHRPSPDFPLHEFLHRATTRCSCTYFTTYIFCGNILIAQIGKLEIATMFSIEIAQSPEHLSRLKSANADPIIFRDNAHEVYVFTKQDEVAERIRKGMSWHSGNERPDQHGYRYYVYTRLNEAQLCEHLQDPTKHQGSDD